MSKVSLLHKYLRQNAAKPLAWGSHDCCTFSCDWVVELGHPDPMAALRGRYNSALGAMRLLKKECGEAEVEAVIGLCDEDGRKYPRVGPKYMQRGDVCLVKNLEFEGLMTTALGIFAGPNIALVGIEGIVYTQRSKAVLAWSL